MTSPKVSQDVERVAPDVDRSAAVASQSSLAGLPATDRQPPPRLLFLDDDPARAVAFLKENPRAIWVQTVPECVEKLGENWDEVHLDHDLGGKTFVDMNQTDCGMEVIRWLCKEPRDHLRQSHFYVHTHNWLAGLLMVLQMQSSGYRAEFRPFGSNPLMDLAGGGDGTESYPEAEIADVPPPARPSTLKRLINLLKRCWPRLPTRTP